MADGVELNAAIHTVLKKIMDKHSAIVFGGNGYSEEWHKICL